MDSGYGLDKVIVLGGLQGFKVKPLEVEQGRPRAAHLAKCVGPRKGEDHIEDISGEALHRGLKRDRIKKLTGVAEWEKVRKQA